MAGDLHCHTRLSNGSMGIEEIIALAKSKGIDKIAITDQDTIAGIERAKIVGERNGITVIPGVELSALDEETGKCIHILCYLPEQPARLEGLCKHNSLVRGRSTTMMCLKLAKKYPVSPELIKRCATGATALFTQHFMHALMEVGAADSFYGDVYKELFIEEGESKIFIQPKFKSVEEVIEAVHVANGVAVLAHPLAYGDMASVSILVSRFMKAGLDGIEVWHPSASAEESEALFQFAKKNKLLSTGGSSFRGLYNKKLLSVGDFVTPEQQMKELMSFKAKQQRLLKKQMAENDMFK